MTRILKHIEIVRSNAPGLSSMSRRSSDAIQAVLRRHYVSVGVSTINHQSDLEVLASKQPDLVFSGMKYVPSATTEQKIWLTEFLDQRSIAHTGSTKQAIEYEFSKPLAKRRVLSAGVPTAKFLVVKRGQAIDYESIELNFPLFVKPTSMGGGTGVDEASFVSSIDELRAKVGSIAHEHASDVLIEEYLPGREFSVALLRDQDSNEITIMPIELVAPSNVHGDPMLSQAVKLANVEVILPVTDPVLRALVNSTALDAFNALGARDYGRIDIKLDKAGIPHFLEANLIPSLISGYGSFPKACVLNQNLGFEAMILSIVSLGFSRTPDSVEAEEIPVFSTILDPLAIVQTAN